MPPTLLHLVYVHGFQGNDTTFQSFPTHVHQYLSKHIQSSSNIQVQTSLYPTYKSRKPISNATRDFLEWLKTQPPGPVILVGHSMGGLLVADAATDPMNPHRIIGMIAFDCPYLGMHPHVVVTGLASLLPKGQDNGKTEQDMNRHPGVTVVDNKVTDDWDEYKKNLNPQNNSSHSIASGPSVSPLPTSPSPTPSPTLSPLPSPSASFVNRAMGFVSSHSDDPLVKWMRKHREKPLADGKQWITEYFQFGSCMFDPTGLTSRYKRLVGWNGTWVNYWTITLPRASSSPGSTNSVAEPNDLVPDNDVALLETGVARPLSFDSNSTSLASPVSSASGTSSQLDKEQEKELKRMRKQREKEAKQAAKAAAKQAKEKAGRHFVVLPTGLGAFLGGGENWEQVVIGGVDDEVAAHTGMFIPGQNLDYEGLVARVGNKVLRWCEKI